MITHYKKELVSNTLTMDNGQTVPFEVLAEDMGVIRLDTEESEDKHYTDEQIKKVVGKFGITEITAEEYDSLKKNLRFETRSSRISQQSALPAIRPFTPASAVNSLAADHAVAVEDTNRANKIGGQLPIDEKPDPLQDRVRNMMIRKAENITQPVGKEQPQAAPMEPAVGKGPDLTAID